MGLCPFFGSSLFLGLFSFLGSSYVFRWISSLELCLSFLVKAAASQKKSLSLALLVESETVLLCHATLLIPSDKIHTYRKIH